MMKYILKAKKGKKDYGKGKRKQLVTYRTKTGKQAQRIQIVGRKFNPEITPKVGKESRNPKPSEILNFQDDGIYITGTNLFIEKDSREYKILESMASKDSFALDGKSYRIHDLLKMKSREKEDWGNRPLEEREKWYENYKETSSRLANIFGWWDKTFEPSREITSGLMYLENERDFREILNNPKALEKFSMINKGYFQILINSLMMEGKLRIPKGTHITRDELLEMSIIGIYSYVNKLKEGKVIAGRVEQAVGKDDIITYVPVEGFDYLHFKNNIKFHILREIQNQIGLDKRGDKLDTLSLDAATAGAEGDNSSFIHMLEDPGSSVIDSIEDFDVYQDILFNALNFFSPTAQPRLLMRYAISNPEFLTQKGKLTGKMNITKEIPKINKFIEREVRKYAATTKKDLLKDEVTIGIRQFIKKKNPKWAKQGKKVINARIKKTVEKELKVWTEKEVKTRVLSKSSSSWNVAVTSVRAAIIGRYFGSGEINPTIGDVFPRWYKRVQTKKGLLKEIEKLGSYQGRMKLNKNERVKLQKLYNENKKLVEIIRKEIAVEKKSESEYKKILEGIEAKRAQYKKISKEERKKERETIAALQALEEQKLEVWRERQVRKLASKTDSVLIQMTQRYHREKQDTILKAYDSQQRMTTKIVNNIFPYVDNELNLITDPDILEQIDMIMIDAMIRGEG